MVNATQQLPAESRTDILRKSALLLIATIVVAVIGFGVVMATSAAAPNPQSQQSHAFQFVLIGAFGFLVLVGVLTQWVINRADDNLWDREIVYGSHPDYSQLVRQCRRRLRANAIDMPLPDDPWSPEAVQKWNRQKWLVPIGTVVLIACGAGLAYWFGEQGFDGPLYSGISQAMIMFPSIILINWRSTAMPPRVEEELYGQETIFDCPWYDYHGCVLDDLGFWFLVSGRAYGRESRGVFLNDAGYLVAELGDEHCRITTVLSDGTAIQTTLRGGGIEIEQVINATTSIHPTTDPAIALIGAFRRHHDAIDTAIKHTEAVPIILAGNYAKALAYAFWKNR